LTPENYKLVHLAYKLLPHCIGWEVQKYSYFSGKVSEDVKCQKLLDIFIS